MHDLSTKMGFWCTYFELLPVSTCANQAFDYLQKLCFDLNGFNHFENRQEMKQWFLSEFD